MTDRYLKEEFERNIPAPTRKALALCSKAADENNIPIFLIGGIVRDIIINRNNFDIDITVQGNAVQFAQFLQKQYPQTCRIRETHDPFKTAKICLDVDNTCVEIDLASTRKESYPHPASLPKVEETGCELYEDVIRRDFSINTMALSLNKDSFCRLVDCLNGYKDLQQGIIRVLHPNSFIDDPTRIIRALKFSVRFGFRLNNETRMHMRECLDSGRFDNLAGERVKLELKQALNTNMAEVMERFIRENIYRLVDTNISIPENINNIEKTIIKYTDLLPLLENIWLIYLGTLRISRQTTEKLYMSGNEQNIILEANRLILTKNNLTCARTRFEIYEFFEKSPIESILAFSALNNELKEITDLYLRELKDITIAISGDDLIAMGLKPGPVFKKLLREILKARINGDISSKEQEIDYLRAIS